MRRRTAVGSALVCALGAPVYLGVGPASSAPKTSADGTSLALAVQGRGVAAGDTVYGAEGNATTHGDAKENDRRINDQANAVKTKKQSKAEAAADAKKVVTKSAKTAGCVPEYGNGRDCLPSVSPDQARMPDMYHPWTCEQVRVVLPGGIKVRKAGVDPQNLDRNDDGTACGPGD